MFTVSLRVRNMLARKGRRKHTTSVFLLKKKPSRFLGLRTYVLRSRSARGARADLHAPKAPKSKAEMEAEAAAEELMAKHREVLRIRHGVNSTIVTNTLKIFWPEFEIVKSSTDTRYEQQDSGASLLLGRGPKSTLIL